MKSISGCLIFEAHQLIDRPYWQMSPSYPKIHWVAIFASAYLQTKLIQNHTKKKEESEFRLHEFHMDFMTSLMFM